MAHGSRKAVVTAIVANSIVTVIKFAAAAVGGSASMMNEAVHSLMDTLNQGFLLTGLVVAEQPADQQYAFGHGQKKYLWNLWSAIGLFSIGCGLGLAHSWHSLHDMHAVEAVEETLILGFISAFWLSLVVLFIATLLEGYSFVVAAKEFWLRMRAEGLSNPFRYLLQSDDPTLVAVVLEDSVAMIGLVMAACGIILSEVTGDPLWDILFSGAIALMLGFIAFYLGYMNMRYLADMRDSKAEKAFAALAASHTEVESCHDIRSIIVDESYTLLVAEIELREEAIVSGLLQQISERKEALLSTVPASRERDLALNEYIDSRAAVEATLARTEQIIQELETELQQQAPNVRHITIEVKGISAAAAIEA
ncbi:MAG: cation diffusion facilitator family transporter [Motiliproteus sp.]